MNVLLFSRILEKTGVGNHVFTLAQELKKQGHFALIVSATKKLDVEQAGVPFIRIPADTKNPIRWLSCIKQLRKIIRENKIDVVHCHHRMAALMMRVYRIFYRIPVVYTLHSAPVPSDLIHRMLTWCGDESIGVSTEVSEFMVDRLGFPASHVHTVLNGVKDPCEGIGPVTEEEKLEQKRVWEIPQDRVVFALHSRIDSVKNHLLVAKAVKELPASIQKKVMVVCSGQTRGDYYEELKNALASFGISHLFRFVGWCDTRSVLSVADCMLMPSIKEGFGLTVAEAFMMNVPVARTKTAGFYDQKYCIPIEIDGPRDVVDLITRFCEDRDSLPLQTKEAFQFAHSVLTLEQMVKNTVEIYKKACEM